ncbi:MAG: Holliday junction branch migration protein RuvA [Christensenellaceae bacterium]|nr:Holliday junction branch migration protein RuvA [Christensenellaceae bacterium]
MYDYIKGEVASADKDYVVIDAGGIGYRVYTSAQSMLNIRVGMTVKLYCHLVVREDSHKLYGFYTPEEREMFLRLTGVSGIGPKVALSILSAMKVSDLAAAIITSDERAFSKVPGVGKKTAQRIIIDLAEKIATKEVFDDGAGEPLPGGAGVEAEAIAALVALGYNRAEAAKAVGSVKNLGDTTEDIILLALRRMGA